MKQRNRSATRTSGFLRVLALVTVLALGATACSGDDSSNGGSSQVTKADAKSASSAVQAGLAAHSKGDLDKAATQYDKALTYDPKNKFALYNLALIDEADANYGLAETKYRAALKTDPKYGPALFNLAILRTKEDPKEAISLYKSAVAADQKDAAAWLNLGLLQRANDEKASGNKSVLRAIALDSTLKDPAEAASGNK
jgi:Tfp pilus assembly protein PilF